MNAVWRVWGGCLEDMVRLSGRCRETVWREYGGCQQGVGRLSGECVKAV